MKALVMVVAFLMQDRDSAPIAVPLDGLTAGCCESAVEQALVKMENVQSVKLWKSGGAHTADIVMKSGHGLALSEIEKALGEANRKMGDAMGTKYKVGDALALAYVHVFKTNSAPDKERLAAALEALKGVKSVWTYAGGFGAAFEGEKPPSIADVKKASGLEVRDLVLSASKGGVRYTCSMHPEKVSPVPAKCPVCSMEMSKTDAGGEPKGEKCATCGAPDPSAGCAKGCADCQKKCPKCGGKGCKKKKKGC